MKRICLLGAALAALLILGATTALASNPHASTKAGGKTKTSKAKTTTTKLTCVSATTQQVPNGDNSVTVGASSGIWGGPAKCSAKQLGTGVEFQSFSTDDAGDLSGKWQAWFNTGAVYGTYTLTPSDTQPPTSDSFTAISYTGTFVIKNGTGADAKITGKGAVACATKDGAHYACAWKGKMTQPVTSTTAKKS